jgi:hypothetical protein
MLKFLKVKKLGANDRRLLVSELSAVGAQDTNQSTEDWRTG